MLGALESIFDLPDPLGPQLLAPHLGQLLAGLQAIVVAGERYYSTLLLGGKERCGGG